MRLAQFLACGALIVAGTVFAASSDYVVTVQQSYMPVDGAGRVAIIPFACPEEVECDDLEKRLTAELVDRASLKITAAAAARKVMANAGIEKLDNETGHILAESLKMDAFVVVDIQEARVEAAESMPAKIGMALGENPRPAKHVMLSLKIVSKDGATLLAASGEAHVSGAFTSLSGVAIRTVEAVLEKAMPDR